MKKLLSMLLAVSMSAMMFVGCGAKEKIVINTAEDLNDKKIGVQSGTTGDTYCSENLKADVVGYKTGMDAALELKNGAIDAVVLDELPAKQIVKQNSDLMILDIALAKDEYAIAVRKGEAELLNSINATIKSLKDNGGYDDLVNAFMPADGQIKIPADLELSGEEIKLGTNAAFHPFEYLDNGKVVGFDISMGQIIAKDLGKTLVVEDINWEALIPALNSGSIDFIAAGMSVTAERLESVDFSDPYYESEQVIIVRK